MSEVKHTPLPWMQVTLHPRSILGNGQVGAHAFEIEPDLIAKMHDERKALTLAVANAALIVKCVNAHDDLVAALKAVQSDERDFQCLSGATFALIDAALASAGEK
jgi:hypothetical protein